MMGMSMLFEALQGGGNMMYERSFSGLKGHESRTKDALSGTYKHLPYIKVLFGLGSRTRKATDKGKSTNGS